MRQVPSDPTTETKNKTKQIQTRPSQAVACAPAQASTARRMKVISPPPISAGVSEGLTGSIPVGGFDVRRAGSRHVTAMWCHMLAVPSLTPSSSSNIRRVLEDRQMGLQGRWSRSVAPGFGATEFKTPRKSGVSAARRGAASPKHMVAQITPSPRWSCDQLSRNSIDDALGMVLSMERSTRHPLAAVATSVRGVTRLGVASGRRRLPAKTPLT